MAFLVDDEVAAIGKGGDQRTDDPQGVHITALAAGEHRVGRLFQSVGGQAISLEGASLPDAVVCNVNTTEELKELLQS